MHLLTINLTVDGDEDDPTDDDGHVKYRRLFKFDR